MLREDFGYIKMIWWEKLEGKKLIIIKKLKFYNIFLFITIFIFIK